MESEIDAKDQFSLPPRITGHLSLGLREPERKRESAWFVLC